MYPMGIASEEHKNSSFCYPNPFTVETTLFSNVDLKNATLKIYNLNGQEIREEKEISGQKIIIKRNELIKGVYLYRIVQGSEIVTTGSLRIE
jgi:hypothetical protein